MAISNVLGNLNKSAEKALSGDGGMGDLLTAASTSSASKVDISAAKGGGGSGGGDFTQAFLKTESKANSVYAMA